MINNNLRALHLGLLVIRQLRSLDVFISMFFGVPFLDDFGNRYGFG